MSYRCHLLSFCVIPVLLAFGAFSLRGQVNDDFDPQTIIVRTVNRSALQSFHTNNGITVQHTFTNLSDVQVLQLPQGLSVATALARYRTNTAVVYAEPNYFRRLAAVPNEAAYANGTLWHLNNSNDADIDAPEGWSVRTSAGGVVVAVIDTGIRQDHPDLQPNFWTNPGEIPNNGLDDDNNGYADDVHGASVLSTQDSARNPNMPGIEDVQGHGTQVSGVLGARGNNETQVPGGTVGVCWDVKLMTIKIYYQPVCAGIDCLPVTTSAYFIKAMDYAISMGASIINYSTSAETPSQAEKDIIGKARDRGMLFVTAPGNDAYDTDSLTTRRYPSGYDIDNIVSVAATTRTDQLASYSNHGNNWVHLAAPGGGGVGAAYPSDYIYTTHSGALAYYTYVSGTSVAAPQVAGALALLKAQYPTESYLQLKHRLMSSTDSLAVLADKCQSGGRLNVNRLLTSSATTPYNDSFSKALKIEYSTLLNFAYDLAVDNVDASKEPGEPNHAGNAGGASVWWKWETTGTFPLKIWTSGSGIDTLLAVYTGTSLGNLTQVVANDDGGQNLSSQVTFTPVAGTTYYIAVDGKNGAKGSIKLHVSSPQAAQPIETKFNVTSLQRLPGQFKATVTFPPGVSLIFERTTDFAKPWGGNAVLISGNGTFNYTDSFATEAMALYRVRRSQPPLNTTIPENLSVNIVGYVDRTVPTGWSMHASPFRTASSTLSSVLSGVMEGTVAYKWNQSQQVWDSNSYVDGAWDNPSWTLEPEEGILLYNPSGAYTLRFVGEAVMGYRATLVPSLYSVFSSRVPEAGKTTSWLAFPVSAGDKIHKMNVNGTWSTFTFSSNGTWSPNEPTLSLGESFFSEKAAPLWWRRNVLPWP